MTKRRLGEMLAGMKQTGEITHDHKNPRSAGVSRTRLVELGLDHHLSSRAQRLAAVPEADFEAAIAEAKDSA